MSARAIFTPSPPRRPSEHDCATGKGNTGQKHATPPSAELLRLRERKGYSSRPNNSDEVTYSRLSAHHHQPSQARAEADAAAVDNSTLSSVLPTYQRTLAGIILQYATNTYSVILFWTTRCLTLLIIIVPVYLLVSGFWVSIMSHINIFQHGSKDLICHTEAFRQSQFCSLSPMNSLHTQRSDPRGAAQHALFGPDSSQGSRSSTSQALHV